MRGKLRAAGIRKRSGISTKNAGSVGNPPGICVGASSSVPNRKSGARSRARPPVPKLKLLHGRFVRRSSRSTAASRSRHSAAVRNQCSRAPESRDSSSSASAANSCFARASSASSSSLLRDSMERNVSEHCAFAAAITATHSLVAFSTAACDAVSSRPTRRFNANGTSAIGASYFACAWRSSSTSRAFNCACDFSRRSASSRSARTLACAIAARSAEKGVHTRRIALMAMLRRTASRMMTKSNAPPALAPATIAQRSSSKSVATPPSTPAPITSAIESMNGAAPLKSRAARVERIASR